MALLQKSRKVGEPYTPDTPIGGNSAIASQAAAKGREALAKIEAAQIQDTLRKKREAELQAQDQRERQRRALRSCSC